MNPYSKKRIFSWCLFDWANSAFPTVIITFVFAAYFTKAVAPSETEGTFLWGQAISLSGLAVAILGPIFGAIADRGGRKIPWLAVFSLICIGSSLALWGVRPDVSSIWYCLVIIVIANAAFEFGTVFYNSMLSDVAPPEKLGRVSGWGWGLGYIGGLSCLALALVTLVQSETPIFGLDKDGAEHIRATGPLVAIWYGLFALPLFLFVRDMSPIRREISQSIREGLASILTTLKEVRQHSNILTFLIARMFYADGLATLFAFGGIYAAGTFGMSFAEIIQFGIALNVTSGLGALAFAWIDDWLGSKRTIIISLLGLLACGAAVLLVTETSSFWAWAMGLGIFIGPAQAASRTMMSKLAPEEKRTEMFGLFALSGKVTAFLGPAILGWVTLMADSQRAGMATILVFWLIGLALMLRVRAPR